MVWRAANRLILAYSALALLWIAAADGILPLLLPEHDLLGPQPWQKDLVFTVATIVALYAIGPIALRRYVATERTLRESERALTTLIGNMPGFVYRCRNESDWPLEFVSPGVREQTGYEPRDFTSGRVAWGSIIHTEDRARVWDEVQESLQQRRRFRLEYRIVHKSGNEHWVLEHGTGVFSSNGILRALEGTITDITEHKHAERSLVRMNQLYAMLSHANQAIVRGSKREELFAEMCRIAVDHGGFRFAWIGVLDPSTLEIQLAAKAGNDHGYLDSIRVSASPVTPLGSGPTGTAVHEGRHWICNDFPGAPETRPWHDAARRAGVAASGAFPIRLRGTAVGSISLYAGEPGFFTPDVIAALDAMARDISFGLENLAREEDRLRDAEALREGALQLETAARAGNVGLWDWDLRTDKVYFSPEWKRQIGYEDHEIRGDFEDWRGRVHPDDLDRSLRAVNDFRSGRQPEYHVEFRFQHKNGSYRWILAQASLLRDDDGRPIRMMGSHVDITDRKRIEEQLAHAQKMEAIGNLTGGMAHDFNNYLAVITGNLELLKDIVTEDRNAAALVENSLRGAMRGAELTRNLLAFSRRQTLNPSTVDVNERVFAISRLLARTIGENIALRVEPAARSAPVWIDGPLFDSAIVNLANNARDAMPKGGTLTISVHTPRVDAVSDDQLMNLQPGDYVVIEVSDSGVGMAADIAEHAFEPFFSTKAPNHGTGLGLSMVYGFVTQSGGQIAIRSAVGEGTTVRIVLPRASEVIPAKTAGVPALPSSSGGHETILVVEDNDDVRRTAVSQLASLGYSTVEAASGDAALEILTHTNPDFDLLFTDVVMPGQTDGQELARRAVQLRPRMKVLLTSGYSRETTGGSGSTYRHLAKPYRKPELARAIREALDS